MPSRLTKIAVAAAIGLTALSATVVAIPAIAATVKGDSPTDAVGKRVAAIRSSLQGLVDDKTLTDAQADKVASTLGSKGGEFGPGDHFRGGPHGFGFGSRFGDEALKPAADVLGMSVADVQTALRNGTTLAELAKQKNKSVDEVVAALTKEATARVDQAVKDGKLTADQATTMKQKLTEGITAFVQRGFPAGKFGRGGPGFGHGPGKGDRHGDDDAPGTPTPSPSTSAGATTSAFNA